MRAYHSAFASHCIRFFMRHPEPVFHTEIDKRNWFAVKNALADFTEKEQEWLREIYSGGDTLADNVYTLSEKISIHQNKLWQLVIKLERAVAKIAGMIQ